MLAQPPPRLPPRWLAPLARGNPGSVTAYLTNALPFLDTGYIPSVDHCSKSLPKHRQSQKAIA